MNKSLSTRVYDKMQSVHPHLASLRIVAMRRCIAGHLKCPFSQFRIANAEQHEQSLMVDLQFVVHPSTKHLLADHFIIRSVGDLAPEKKGYKQKSRIRTLRPSGSFTFGTSLAGLLRTHCFLIDIAFS